MYKLYLVIFICKYNVNIKCIEFFEFLCSNVLFGSVVCVFNMFVFIILFDGLFKY